MSDHSVKRRKLSPSPGQIKSSATVAAETEKADHTVARKDAHQSSTHPDRRAKDDHSAELAMASGFYKSSFFKLQVDELLSGLKMNYDKRISKLQDTLHKVKGAIENLPDRSPKSIPEAEKELRTASGIMIPWPEPRPSKDAKYTMSYMKPTNINVVGSFALRTGAKTAESRPVDLAVTMPGSIFQEKDYVNYRYFHKRAYYVACLAAGIQETANALGLDVKFGFQDGDSLRPLLLLEPHSSKGDVTPSRPQIRILTAIDPTLFPITRTLPSKNNIRQGSATEKESDISTSFYNASLRSEASVSLCHKYLHFASQKCESFRDACILGRTWLQQRGLHTSFQHGGFGGFEWSALISLLFEGGGPSGQPILLRSYSSYQIFKATMQFLAGRDLTTPLVLFATEISVSSNGKPVLYDGRLGLNLLYKMTPWSYKMLRHEASMTLKMLNESREDNFDRVFIVKVDEPALRFDRLIAFPKFFNGGTLQSLRDQTKLYNVLSRALGDRIKLISLTSHSVGAWSVRAKAMNKTATKDVSVGLMLNADNVSRVVDHGPSAEDKEEAASFRAFWGEKAELRRFKDGSILESLVWSDQESEESIVHQILAHVLQRHLKISEDDFFLHGDEYDDILHDEGDGVVSYSNSPFQSINDAFRELEQSIRSMDDVPLTIRHLAPASPLLRYSALRVQGASGAHGAADVVLQFESSSRWPDDFAAIQMTKTAFLIKIGDSLESSGAASSCRVGLENESSKVLNNAYLDIPHTSGFTFRLRIHHEREQTLLERQLKNKTISPREREEAAYALFAYKKVFIQTPRLTQALRSLCTRFPLLSPTIRLVKHWFASHLFSAQISEELIELLTTRVFTQSYPWDSPSSIMTGFLRTLHFISRWDWQQEPFIVDLGGDLNPEITETIRTRFTAWRNIDPAMNTVALFIASDVDPDGVTWTQYEMPSKVVAGRMSMLAKAAVNLLRTQHDELDVTDLFHTSLAPYDFVIHLQSKMFNGRSVSRSKYKNLADAIAPEQASKLAVVKSFIQEVQACYSQSILLFYGNESSGLVAGLWNPQTLKPRNWNLKTAFSTAPASVNHQEKEGLVMINQAAILNEIARLGDGFIDRIETSSSVEEA